MGPGQGVKSEGVRGEWEALGVCREKLRVWGSLPLSRVWGQRGPSRNRRGVHAHTGVSTGECARFFFFPSFFIFIYLFIWLCRVLVVAGGLLSCDTLAP